MTDKPSILLKPELAASWQRGFKEGWNSFAGPKSATAVPSFALGGSLSLARLKEIQALECMTEPDERAELQRFLDGLPANNIERARATRQWFMRRVREIETRRDAKSDKRAELEAEHERLNRLIEAFDELTEWTTNLLLEKAEETHFRELRRACADNKAITFDVRLRGHELESTVDYEKEYLRHAELFVVQHDWAAAFSGAEDMKAAPFKLPYEMCAFEFRISGRPVIALATELDERVTFTPAALTKAGWFIPGFVYFQSGELWIANQDKYEFKDTYDKIVPFVGDQIRAICIALDAEVATTTLKREAHVGQRNNAYATPKPYHIVSLARRERAPSLEGATPTGRKKRLHLRRGHWRHFPGFKTWIRWCLVGDPDLGFVDKEYRL